MAVGIWLLLGQSGAAMLRLPSRDALVALADPGVSSANTSDAIASTSSGAGPSLAGAKDTAYQLGNAALVRQTLALIQRLYLEVGELSPPAMFLAGLEGLASAAPDALWVPAHGDVPGALMVGRRVLLLEPTSFASLPDLGEAFARVFSFYLQSREIEVDDPLVEYATIRGMLSLLDRPSQLLIDDRLDDFKTRSRGTLSGIGCRIGMRQDEPTVIKVLESSPSEAAGLREGDRVSRVEGESTTNMSLSEVVNRLRGTAGTWVTIDIRRGDELLSFRILRDNIRIENVEAHRLPGDIGYVRITNFNDETLSNFRTRLDRIAPHGEGLKGLVIDLRQNGGGSLQQSAFMVDEFVAAGTIVRTIGKSGEKVSGLIPQFTAQEPQIMSDRPVAILVDRRTASGSEILAGALKYLNRAVLIGQRTYGKGSVQKLYPLNDHSSLKLTIARYLLPGDHYIHSVGLQPDIVLVPVVAGEDSIRFRDSVERDDEEESEEVSKPGVAPQAPREEPSATVFYLDGQTPRGIELAPLERLWNDFEVRFAAQLLANVHGGVRAEALDQSRPFIEKMKEEQSTALVAALKERGIDWTLAETAPGAQAEVKLGVEPGGDGLKPGEKANLSLQVTNQGSAAFSRLRAVSVSDDPLLDGLEFMFGRVDPGQSRSWPVSLSVPAGAAPGLRGLAFHFTAEGSSPPPPFETGIIVQPGPSPYVEIEATYEDHAARGTPGDNNRMIEAGEEVAIKLWVRNTGQAPTGQLSLSLRNPLRKDLELHSARVVLDPIPAGEQREATLSFEMKGATAGTEAAQARLTLLIVDRVHHLRLTRDLDFGQPWSGRLQILPPRLQVTSVVPSATVRDPRYTIAGRVSDVQGIREVTFYRGRQKVHRILPGLQAEKPVTMLPFRAEIPLSPGSNLLEVISQDETGLISRKQLWISAAR